MTIETRPLVVALANQKGGVGKTTTTGHLARAAAVRGLRVLVVDLDPQGNTTQTISADDLERDTVGIADVLAPGSDITLDEIVVPTVWDHVTLAPTPSTEALTTAQDRIASATYGREYRLVETLDGCGSEYDLVLIDNAPSLALLLVNALTAASTALIVTQPEQWSADGLAELHRTISGVQRYFNSALQVAGPLVNGKRSRSTHHDRILGEITEYYDGRAWTDPDEVIPLWSGVADYLLAGTGLDEAREAKLRGLSEVYGRFIERLLAQDPREVSA